MKKNNTLRLLTALNTISWYAVWAVAVGITIFFIGTFIQPDWLVHFNEMIIIETPISSLLLGFGLLSQTFVPFAAYFEIMITISLVLIIINYFRHLFKAFSSKIFFTQENISRITKIAYLLIALIVLELNPTDLFFALFILLFAQVLQHGYEIEKENKLTV